MAKIVVCGYMIRHPVAGNLMAFFHYLLGFAKLGHTVTYLEESGWDQSCYDPNRQTYSNNPAVGIRAVKALLQRFDVSVPIGFVDCSSGECYGLSRQEISQSLKDADLLLNIGGVCWLPEFLQCSRRALIDMDPLFTQLGQFGGEGQQRYHACFSYGVNIGQPQCMIPTNETDWLPVVPPVVPEIWDAAIDLPSDAAFTTIANWKAYGGTTYKGEHYGQKRESFLQIVELPQQTSQPLELSLSGASSTDIAQLTAAGWAVCDSRVSDSFDPYWAYITRSRGEFSAAKQAYVKTRSGWFSDRSVCYLAAGRPTVLQDTGFSDWLDTSWGILAFSSQEEAAEKLAHVEANYAKHQRAARVIASEIFSYQKVLPHLLNRAMSNSTEIVSSASFKAATPLAAGGSV